LVGFTSYRAGSSRAAFCSGVIPGFDNHIWLPDRGVNVALMVIFQDLFTMSGFRQHVDK
jgi:hypothetical protein